MRLKRSLISVILLAMALVTEYQEHDADLIEVDN